VSRMNKIKLERLPQQQSQTSMYLQANMSSNTKLTPTMRPARVGAGNHCKGLMGDRRVFAARWVVSIVNCLFQAVCKRLTIHYARCRHTQRQNATSRSINSVLKAQANLTWRRDDEGECVRFCRYTYIDEMRRKETRYDPKIAVIRSAVPESGFEVPVMHVMYQRGTSKFEHGNASLLAALKLFPRGHNVCPSIASCCSAYLKPVL